MLVPELLDITEQLKIPNAKKWISRNLFYKILDKQAAAASETPTEGTEKPKRKRIVKASTANTSEEAIVMSDETDKQPKRKAGS